MRRPFARRGGRRDSGIFARGPSAEALGFDMPSLPGPGVVGIGSARLRLKRLRKKAGKQIPHGLKSVRNDKKQRAGTAQLKLRPFKSV